MVRVADPMYNGGVGRRQTLHPSQTLVWMAGWRQNQRRCLIKLSFSCQLIIEISFNFKFLYNFIFMTSALTFGKIGPNKIRELKVEIINW